ncbi:Dihydromonacolin L monooxygenase LovA 4, partial [Colletotrichum chlorophyti]
GYALLRDPILHPGFPIVGIDNKTWRWFKFQKAVQEYNTRGKQIIEEGCKTRKPFQVVTETGTKLCFPPNYAEELKNIKALSFSKALTNEFSTSYGGFEPIRTVSHESNAIQSITRLKITPSLSEYEYLAEVLASRKSLQLLIGYLTDDIAEEASTVLKEQLGICKKWSEITFKPFVSRLIAHLSARLFVGTELCSNQEWLSLSTSYAVDCFSAAYSLRRWHPLIRWPVSWFLPECRRLRRTVANARRLLAPVIKERLKKNENIEHRPKRDKESTADTIVWLHEAYRKAGVIGKWNVADAQLGLSIVAIATTTELLTCALFDIIAAGPRFVDELRSEIISVLGAVKFDQFNDGHLKLFSKTNLYQMKLLDSALKESQRLHTRGVGAMGRVAEADVLLSDGLIIPRGAFSIVTLAAYHDEKLYPQPQIYNPRRFLELRSQPGQEKNWQLVTTSPEHLGFGYGDHACPGRFLAANEVKIALVYLLMEYDWKLPGQKPQDILAVGSVHEADAKAKVLFRKRDAEVVL